MLETKGRVSETGNLRSPMDVDILGGGDGRRVRDSPLRATGETEWVLHGAPGSSAGSRKPVDPRTGPTQLPGPVSVTGGSFRRKSSNILRPIRRSFTAASSAGTCTVPPDEFLGPTDSRGRAPARDDSRREEISTCGGAAVQESERRFRQIARTSARSSGATWLATGLLRRPM